MSTFASFFLVVGFTAINNSPNTSDHSIARTWLFNLELRNVEVEVTDGFRTETLITSIQTGSFDLVIPRTFQRNIFWLQSNVSFRNLRPTRRFDPSDLLNN